MRGILFIGALLMAGCAGAEGDNPADASPTDEAVATAKEAWVIPSYLAQGDARFAYFGQFQLDDCGRNNVANYAWYATFGQAAQTTCYYSGTQTQNNRSLMPESRCGGNQYVCEYPGNYPSLSLRFGGAYQIDDCGRNNVGNFFQSGGFGCTAGYTAQAIGRVMGPESNCGGWQYICVAPPSTSYTQTQDRMRWGGQYQVDDCATNSRANPFTGATNCPHNYVPIQYGRVKGPEGRQCGVTQYYCTAYDAYSNQ